MMKPALPQSARLFALVANRSCFVLASMLMLSVACSPAFAASTAVDDEGGQGSLGVRLDRAESGVLITEVVEGSAAEEGGLLAGDVVLKINDRETPEPRVMIGMVQQLRAGDEIVVQIQRADETLDLNITLHEVVIGITGHQGPEWELDEWYNLPEGVESLEVDDYRGKVLYLYCFQSWCPGCHSSGFPSLKEVQEHYADNENVEFVVVQTVFEGFQRNTFERGCEVVDGFELDIPMGQDAGSSTGPSHLMHRYRTQGTPWTIIIDQEGVVRGNNFHLEPEDSIELIDQLLEEATNEAE